MIMRFFIDLKAGKNDKIKTNMAIAKISIEIAMSKGISNDNRKKIKKFALIAIRISHTNEIVFQNFNL